MKKYNLSKLFKKAWTICKKRACTFGAALKLAWAWLKAQPINAAKVEAAAIAAGFGDAICKTWYGWKTVGRVVIHGEKASFQVVIDTPEYGEGKTYKASFFTYEQTQLDFAAM